MIVDRAPKRRKLSAEADGLPGFTKWNLEETYERRNRKDRKPDGHQKLPYKTAQGQVIAQASDDIDDDFDNASEVDSAIADLDLEESKPEEVEVSHREQVIATKEELARIAELISESPEEHIGLLNKLRDISMSDNEVAKRLCLGTQLAVYKDIIPGYRIRPLSKDELLGKISKDVKLLRTFEQGLLNGYTTYVKTLAGIARARSKGEEHSLAGVAVACVCALLQAAHHFNLRNDLIDILVNQLSRPSPDEGGSFNRAVSCFETVFEDDDDGHVSLEIVTRMTAMMKRKNYHVHEALLNTFLHLRLLNEFQGKASTERINAPEDDIAVKRPLPLKKKREFRTKQQRKHLREVKAVEKEMKEADAVVSHEERDKFQGETLKIIFVTYFRILKARIQHLSGAVLEGLARFAHLINQDFFGDVLEVLRELISEAAARYEDDDDLSVRSASREALLCTTTAFAMLQGQIEVVKSAGQLQLDLNFFTAHLYRSLAELSLEADIELSEKNAHLQDPNGLTTSVIDTKVNVATTTVLLMRSLQAVLLPAANSRSVPPARIAAFVKQMLSASLHLPAKSTYAVLNLIESIVKAHGVKIGSLWNTEERRGDGVYNALSEEPEAANSFAATAWEGELLKHHFDPKVRETQKVLQRSVRAAVK